MESRVTGHAAMPAKTSIPDGLVIGATMPLHAVGLIAYPIRNL